MFLLGRKGSGLLVFFFFSSQSFSTFMYFAASRMVEKSPPGVTTQFYREGYH